MACQSLFCLAWGALAGRLLLPPLARPFSFWIPLSPLPGNQPTFDDDNLDNLTPSDATACWRCLRQMLCERQRGAARSSKQRRSTGTYGSYLEIFRSVQTGLRHRMGELAVVDFCASYMYGYGSPAALFFTLVLLLAACQHLLTSSCQDMVDDLFFSSRASVTDTQVQVCLAAPESQKFPIPSAKFIPAPCSPSPSSCPPLLIFPIHIPTAVMTDDHGYVLRCIAL